ncbi:alpha-ketoglutarate-dependent dioxygenase alkB homolog 4 [Eucyclogobius newberryi]|uniref:alpha-ketoglutarate-dependent dioxygenase alkB homolog 4 n=1 Tax=Eucyclogobius newberryi TaxID=166745 RepID=UPI003B597794
MAAPGAAVNTDMACACKGVRSCLLCEKHLTGAKQQEQAVHHFVFDAEEKRAVCRDGEASFILPGVFLWENFITAEEEEELVSHMDQSTWTLSQSGRRKQDFGPKVNFKKKKVRVGLFNGLPALSRWLVERMQQEQTLKDFAPVEQCNLDYRPERGAHIEPHLDDTWLWGERLVTVNMLSDTTLTLSLQQEEAELQVAVPLSRRSLLVLSGPARHTWKHSIQRAHISQRRVCSTFRELSAEFLPGGARAELGSQLLHTALTFTGAPP